MVTRMYTVGLVIKALLLSGLALRCVWAVYKNHLERRVRIVVWGTLAVAATSSLESWVRALGRVEQWMCGIEPTQMNPELALAALMLTNVGLLAWIVTMEVTTHLGVVDPEFHRREDDPKRGV